jgi:hypothetical protein
VGPDRVGVADESPAINGRDFTLKIRSDWIRFNFVTEISQILFFRHRHLMQRLYPEGVPSSRR